MKEGDSYTIKDRINVSCEDRADNIQEDIREIFKREKKKQPLSPDLPVAQLVKGGKRKSRKKNRTRKKNKLKKRMHKKSN